MSDLKRNFDLLKKEKKLTATAVANKMGVSLPALYSYFNGQPQTNNLIKIAEALGVPVDRLIASEPETNMVQEPSEAYQVTKPNDDMTLEEYKEAMATQKELIMLQKEKILTLEKELKACQDSNRVYPR